MHLAISFDQNFITPTYVFLTSVFANNKEHAIHFHAIATGVSNNDKQEIANYIQQNGSDITYYTIDDTSLNQFVVPEHSYFTVATYYRLFFPALVPEHVQQLLYIDTDTVVVGNLGSLYHTNINPYPVAAALDAAVITRPDLGVTQPGHYFNAGVLLINIKVWKDQHISEKAIQFLLDFPERIQWVDQDALNAILYQNIYKLSNNYNITFYDIPPTLARSKYQEFLTDKYVIHYTTGLHKPWSLLGENKLRYVYHNYLKNSPRKNEKKYKTNKINLSTALFFLKVRLLERLYDYPAILNIMRKRY